MRQLKITTQITNREAQSLDKYLQEIGKIRLLTIDEEVGLAQRIREGDQAALQRMVSANLRFVVSVSKQYQNQGLSLGDLINEGNVGLMQAALRFDETRGFKFISYAVWHIRQSIMLALAEKSRVVRIPFNRVARLNRLNRTFSELEQQLQRDPSPEEIADMMETAPDDIQDIMKIGMRQVSIDAPFSHNEESSLLDRLENTSEETPDAKLVERSLGDDIQRALSTLTQREADIISLYYGLKEKGPLTLEEIGAEFGLTRERTRQIKEKAIRRLRSDAHSQALRDHLE